MRYMRRMENRYQIYLRVLISNFLSKTNKYSTDVSYHKSYHPIPYKNKQILINLNNIK